MDTLPPNAQQHLPILIAEMKQYWPNAPLPAALAAQVEQETCPKLSSPICWSPHAELKTAREYGFGLGQLTITSRFNSFENVQLLDPSLKTWKWSQRYDPQMQLRAMVLMDKNLFQRFTAATLVDQMAFALSAYNGGIGGVLNDKKLCGQIKHCDESRWFEHVEKKSFKQRIKVKGYGQSFYDINRGYVRSILKIRHAKYLPYMEKENVISTATQ